MFGDFKKFLLSGNIVELAVAFIMAGAFALVVQSLVEDIINPIIAAIIGKPDFSELTISVGDATITYGNFITTLINFVLIAAAVFFLIVKPVGAAMSRVHAPALVIGISTDLLYPNYQQRHIDAVLRAGGNRSRYVEIDSPHGHDAFLINLDQLAEPIADFLAA